MSEQVNLNAIARLVPEGSRVLDWAAAMVRC